MKPFQKKNISHRLFSNRGEIEVVTVANPLLDTPRKPAPEGFTIFPIQHRQTDKFSWHLLQNNKCPQCKNDFTKGLTVTEGGKIGDMIAGDMSDKMLMHKCGFMITEIKYKAIVESRITQKLNHEQTDDI